VHRGLRQKKKTNPAARAFVADRSSIAICTTTQHSTHSNTTQPHSSQKKKSFLGSRVFFIRILESTRKKGFLHASSSPSARPTRPNVASRRVRFSDRDAR
jgi:hypothetical protein